MKIKAGQKYKGRIEKDIQADGNRVGDISLFSNSVLEQPRKGEKNQNWLWERYGTGNWIRCCTQKHHSYKVSIRNTDLTHFALRAVLNLYGIDSRCKGAGRILQVLSSILMIALDSCCRFVGYASMMQIFHYITSQVICWNEICDGGGHFSFMFKKTVGDYSSFVRWHVILLEVAKMVHCRHESTEKITTIL